jgi:hypothetical protein
MLPFALECDAADLRGAGRGSAPGGRNFVMQQPGQARIAHIADENVAVLGEQTPTGLKRPGEKRRAWKVLHHRIENETTSQLRNGRLSLDLEEPAGLAAFQHPRKEIPEIEVSL